MLYACPNRQRLPRRPAARANPKPVKRALTHNSKVLIIQPDCGRLVFAEVRQPGHRDLYPRWHEVYVPGRVMGAGHLWLEEEPVEQIVPILFGGDRIISSEGHPLPIR